MIPKVIHYCWFGGKELPALAMKCIASWKKYMPDYEIKRWDETNFDYKSFVYTDEAYSCGKYAFVSDVARLSIIYNYGGIYLDTDVELISSLDKVIMESGYLGFQYDSRTKCSLIATGLGFGAEKGDWLIKAMLDDYEGIHFINNDKSMNLLSCPTRNSIVVKRYGAKMNNTKQKVGDLILYPNDYFCPMDEASGEIKITNNTLSIHHFGASWLSASGKFKKMLRQSIGVDNWEKGKRLVKTLFNMK